MEKFKNDKKLLVRTFFSDLHLHCIRDYFAFQMLVLFPLFFTLCAATGGSVSYQYLTQDGVGSFSYTLSHTAHGGKPDTLKPVPPPMHVPIFKQGAKGQTIISKPLRLSAYTNQEDFVPLVVDADDDDSIQPTTVFPTIGPPAEPPVETPVDIPVAAPEMEGDDMADTAGKSQHAKATYAGIDVKQVPGSKKSNGNSKAKKTKAVHTKPKKSSSSSTTERSKKPPTGVRPGSLPRNVSPVFPAIQPSVFQLFQPMRYAPAAPAALHHNWYQPRYVQPMVHPVSPWHGPVHMPMLVSGVPTYIPQLQFDQSEAKEGGSEGQQPQAEWYHRDP
ncbi:uncharacterized protein LOC129763169 isoform X2 [Toxorhynchites rutilus septentrionalis]|uniref:uncharacterized protein LOC129763169 isoform X2 n=1 Tax=Toxorhynchites rutilus septentrionalis TaxID=329112 RepID=UPI002479CC3F|nr:uncharacterized protein LOC129763169 isoform X2 [Toxorhynchites rutilus septentrionalis]